MSGTLGMGYTTTAWSAVEKGFPVFCPTGEGLKMTHGIEEEIRVLVDDLLHAAFASPGEEARPVLGLLEFPKGQPLSRQFAACAVDRVVQERQVHPGVHVTL